MTKLYDNSVPKILRYKVFFDRFYLGSINSNESCTVWTVSPNEYYKFLDTGVFEKQADGFPIFTDALAWKNAMAFYANADAQQHITYVTVRPDGSTYSEGESDWEDDLKYEDYISSCGLL